MRTLPVKIAAARAVGTAARRAGRGGGTSLPGKVLMRLAPDAIARLAARLERGSAVISATNGKTTTAAMAAEILRRDGFRLVHNQAGANMAGGVASTLLGAARRGDRMEGDFGLFELDEFWLDQLVPQLRPRAIVLGNLFRDQLDRYGELETIADRWSRAAAEAQRAGARLVLCADDPAIADLGRGADDGPGEGVSYFGVEDASLAVAEMQHASDSKHCRRCGAPYVYEAIYLGHLGRYHCPNCGRRRPSPAVSACDVVLRGTRSAAFRLRTPAGDANIELPLPGLYNVYNALAAATLCLQLGVDLETVTAGLESVRAAFGRAETVRLEDHELAVLLVKNPAGANEILRTLALEEGPLELLAILNDRIADGRDISWVWDADWEVLAPHVRRMTCSGTRAAELALRLKYAGVGEERLEVVPAPAAALDRLLAGAEAERVFALPTYTAMLELRDVLGGRGHVREFWQRELAPAAGAGA